jgi:hypothetical protein
MARRKRYAVWVEVINKTEWRGCPGAFHPTVVDRRRVLKWITPPPKSRKSEADVLETLYEGENENENQ